MASGQFDGTSRRKNGRKESMMAGISRRKLLAKSGMGAAAAGLIVAAPGVATSTRKGSTQMSNKQPISSARLSTVPSVTYVRDAARGEVVLMFGEREVVRTDPALVAYLSRCCGDSTI
jgi:hypothetical protein